jgi:hypothetical protein
MSMEINNSYGTYTTSYTNTAKKADSTKESNVTTSTVEMKTSTSGVTRTEQIKTGYSNVNDYSQYLQSKYSYMNTGTTSMQGVPTTVSVSSAFLQKCMNDPEKAKYLEENLAAIPDSVKSLCNSVKMAPGSPVVTYATYKIDDNGNISMMSGSTNDPDGKIAKENAERKAKEKKAAEEKAAKSRAEKKAEQEKLAEKRAEKKANEEARAETPDYTVSATGTDIKTVTQSVVSASLGTSTSTGASFDIKA